MSHVHLHARPWLSPIWHAFSLWPTARSAPFEGPQKILHSPHETAASSSSLFPRHYYNHVGFSRMASFRHAAVKFIFSSIFTHLHFLSRLDKLSILLHVGKQNDLLNALLPRQPIACSRKFRFNNTSRIIDRLRAIDGSVRKKSGRYSSAKLHVWNSDSQASRAENRNVSCWIVIQPYYRT